MRRRGSSDAARRLGLLAVASGLAAALGAVGTRRWDAWRRARGEYSYRCTCGTTYRVTGVDRHRVYWQDGSAVVGDRCVACDAALPAGHDGAVV